MKIQFLGASKTVTGSCHLITTDKYKILLDCGQFQGGKKIERLNYEPFGIDVSEIDYLFLSHAHIDHSGRIPLLVKRGFKGKIFCTKATYDLVEILLRDSGFIHEREAEWQNRKRMRAGKESVEPLYTYEDAVDSLVYFNPVLYEQTIKVNEDITVKFNDAGHILGSAIIELWINENGTTKKIVFTGDLGMKDKPLLNDPIVIDEADYLIMETTYGNRIHADQNNRIEILINIILKTINRGGTVVIPSFAVGRTQEILYELNKYYDDKEHMREEMNKIHVYVDSPLATSATEIFERNAQVFDDETKEYILKGDNPLDFSNLHFTRTTAESIALNEDKTPKVIISASGMCDAGRIKHHLKHHLWIPEASIIFVGYQAEGTLGRRIKDGQKDVKIFGEPVHINAEIHSIEGFSGHADERVLIEWLSNFKKQPNKIFLVHGEADSKIDFAKKINNELGFESIIAQPDTEYELDGKVERINKDDENKVDFEKIASLSDEIHDLRDQLENTLYRTKLALDDDISKEEYTKIKNKVIELEKDIINLSIITGE